MIARDCILQTELFYDTPVHVGNQMVSCNVWRGAGVVERGGLENRCTRKGAVGSNPTLSAIFCLKKVRSPVTPEPYQLRVLTERTAPQRGILTSPPKL